MLIELFTINHLILKQQKVNITIIKFVKIIYMYMQLS